MAWTVTLDASHKVKSAGGHPTKFARHLGRDEDKRAGFDFKHSNAGIVPERTVTLNATMVNDGAGGYRTPIGTDTREPSAELTDYLHDRLSTVKKPLRKDAVVARPFVFKIDPDWFKFNNPDWKTEGLNDAALAIHEEATRFIESWGGQQNVVGYSDHLDEAGSPERQIMFTPVTDDGRLSQKDFFSSPSKLRQLHKELREHLRVTCGYDASDTVSKRSREHLSSDEFSAQADLYKQNNERLVNDLEGVARQRDNVNERANKVVEKYHAVQELQTRVQERSEALDSRSADLDTREVSLSRREASVADKEVEQHSVSADLETRTQAVQSREADLAQQHQALQRERQRVKDERRKAEQAVQAYASATQAAQSLTPSDMTEYMYRYMSETQLKSGETLLDHCKAGAVETFKKSHPLENFDTSPAAKRTVGQADAHRRAVLGGAAASPASSSARGKSTGFSR